MIHATWLWLALLEKTFSVVSAINRPTTGNWWQAGLLRAMGVKVAGPVAIGPGARFAAAPNLKLGRYVSIGPDAYFGCFAPVSIGDDFLCAERLTVNSGSHDLQTLAPRNAPIYIGARVWCGSAVTICAGVYIGDDVVIGAGSVVVKSLPSGCVAVGIPARPIRTLDRGADPPLWSVWPERTRADNRFSRSSRLKQFLYRLRNRL
jgi:maltose O-acetyltransferase